MNLKKEELSEMLRVQSFFVSYHVNSSMNGKGFIYDFTDQNSKNIRYSNNYKIQQKL